MWGQLFCWLFRGVDVGIEARGMWNEKTAISPSTTVSDTFGYQTWSRPALIHTVTLVPKVVIAECVLVHWSRQALKASEASVVSVTTRPHLT